MTRAATGRVVLAAAAAGLASGARSTLGPAASRLSAGPSRRAQLAIVASVAGELVGDKLPRTPSRLKAGPLSGRLTAGTVTGALLARGQGQPVLVPAVVGAAAALAGSYAGARWRREWARTGRPDLGAALIEDAVGIGLAYTAFRLATPR